MNTAFRFSRALACCAALSMFAWGQSGYERKHASRGAGKDIGGGAADIGKGTAKGAGHLLEGTGKGVLDLATLHPVDAGASAGKGALTAGKDVGVGAVKGSARIGKGIGKGLKKIF